MKSSQLVRLMKHPNENNWYGIFMLNRLMSLMGYMFSQTQAGVDEFTSESHSKHFRNFQPLVKNMFMTTILCSAAILTLRMLCTKNVALRIYFRFHLVDLGACSMGSVVCCEESLIFGWDFTYISLSYFSTELGSSKRSFVWFEWKHCQQGNVLEDKHVPPEFFARICGFYYYYQSDKVWEQQSGHCRFKMVHLLWTTDDDSM